MLLAPRDIKRIEGGITIYRVTDWGGKSKGFFHGEKVVKIQGVTEIQA